MTYILCGLLGGCEGCGTETPSTPPVAPDTTRTVYTPPSPPPDTASSFIDSSFLLQQFRQHIARDSQAKVSIDQAFMSGDNRFAIITDKEPGAHYIYLALCYKGQIKKCAELERVVEMDPAAISYSYKDLTSYNDTTFDLTVYSSRVTDTNLIQDGRLRPPNTLGSIETEKDTVNDYLLPSMLLSDTIIGFPGIWKAQPPFRPTGTIK